MRIVDPLIRGLTPRRAIDDSNSGINYLPAFGLKLFAVQGLGSAIVVRGIAPQSSSVQFDMPRAATTILPPIG
jgi:hypothetical protein